MKLKKPTTGEPKWDWMVTFKLPFNLRDIKLAKPHLGKGFLKRVLGKIRVKI